MRPDRGDQAHPGRNWHLVLVVVLVFALCLGGFLAGFRFLAAGTGPPSRAEASGSASRDVAVTFAGHVRAGAAGPAYALLCRTARAEFDEAAFTAHLAARKPATTVDVTGTLTGGPHATPDISAAYREWQVFTVWFEYIDGSDEVRHVPVVREPGGEYRVCGHPF